MRSRPRWILTVLASCGSCFVLGLGCRDRVRTALFTEALQFVQGQVADSLQSFDDVPVDTIIGNVLNPSGVRS